MNLKVPGSSDRKNHKLSVNRNVSFLLPLPSSSRRPPRAIRSQLRTPAPFRPEAVTSSSATIVVSAVLANASVGECSTVDIASRHLARDPSLRLLARTQAPLLSCPSDESPTSPSPKRTACKPFRNLPLPPQAETSGYLCTGASRPTSRDFRGVGGRGAEHPSTICQAFQARFDIATSWRRLCRTPGGWTPSTHRARL